MKNKVTLQLKKSMDEDIEIYLMEKRPINSLLQ